MGAVAAAGGLITVLQAIWSILVASFDAMYEFEFEDCVDT